MHGSRPDRISSRRYNPVQPAKYIPDCGVDRNASSVPLKPMHTKRVPPFSVRSVGMVQERYLNNTEVPYIAACYSGGTVGEIRLGAHPQQLRIYKQYLMVQISFGAQRSKQITRDVWIRIDAFSQLSHHHHIRRLRTIKHCTYAAL
jgi:hypothetical protein